MAGQDLPIPAPDKDTLVERYLEHVRVEKRLAQRTVELYALDLVKLQANCKQAGVALTEVQHVHMRRWVAQMHSGVPARFTSCDGESKIRGDQVTMFG